MKINKNKWVKLFFLFLLFIFGIKNTEAKSLRLRIAIDASASMKGFFSTGALPDLVNQLISICDNNIELLKCKTKIFRSNSLDVDWVDWIDWVKEDGQNKFKKSHWGQFTYLSKAMTELSKNAEAIVLITDNFDEGSNSDTSEFYKSIRDNNYEYAFLTPYLMPYKGNIDIVDEQNKFKDVVDNIKNINGIDNPRVIKSANLWKVYNYDGKKGVAVYILSKSSNSNEIKSLKLLLSALPNNKDIIPIYPLGLNNYKINTGSINQFKQQKCLTDKDKKLVSQTISKKSLSEFSNIEGAYVIKVPGAEAYFDPRKDGVIRFIVNISDKEESKFEIKSEDCISSAISISADKFKVNVLKPEFVGMLLPDYENISIQAHAIPSKMILSNTGAAVLVELKIPPFVGPNISLDILRDGLIANFKLNLNIPSSSFDIKKDIEKKFFTSNKYEISKIYSSVNFINHITPKEKSSISISYGVNISPSVLANEKKQTPSKQMEYKWFIAIAIAIITMLEYQFALFGFYFHMSVDDQKKSYKMKIGGVLKPSKAVKIKHLEEYFFVISRAHPLKKNILICDGQGATICILKKPADRYVLDTKKNHRIEWLSSDQIAVHRERNIIEEIR